MSRHHRGVRELTGDETPEERTQRLAMRVKTLVLRGREWLQRTEQAALDIGRQLARQIFAERGNHAEAHLREAELPAVLALAAKRALKHQAGVNVSAD